MRNTILALTLLLVSCSTTHKVKTSTSKKIDSVATVAVDSSKVNTVASKTDVVNAEDVDIKIDFTDSAKGDSVKPFIYKAPVSQSNDPMSLLIKDAIANSGQAGNIASMEIHIGSIGDSTAVIIAKDSTNVKTVSHTDLKKTVDTKTKDVTRSGMSWWVWVLVGLGVLIAAAFALVKMGIKL